MARKDNLISYDLSTQSPGAIHMLKLAYNQLYIPLFPFDDEREPLDAWINPITNRDQDVSVVARIICADSAHPETIAGFGVGKYFSEPDVGFLSCIAVAPDFRTLGLGKDLVHALVSDVYLQADMTGNPLQGIFFETNNPAKTDIKTDSVDPAKRLRLYQLWGCRQIDISYTQPPLEPEGDFCDKMLLMAHPHPKDGSYPSAKAVQGFIDVIYADPIYQPEKTVLYNEIETWRAKNTAIRKNDCHYKPDMC